MEHEQTCDCAECFPPERLFSRGMQRQMAEVKALLEERDELIRLLQNCLRTMEVFGCGGTVDACAARDYLVRKGDL